MKNGNEKIQLELNMDEINLVLTALGQLPYVQVAGMVDNICKQVEMHSKEETNSETK